MISSYGPEPTRRTALAVIAGAALAGCEPAPARSRAVPTRFGANACRLFLDSLPTEGRLGAADLEAFGRAGIPFVRFAGSGQWAGDWAAFEADPARTWRTFDTLVAAAEHSGVRLVPSVLWHTVALAFHCGEPMQAWADPASRTRRLARRYTETFVSRYDRSPALLMYEFANELNDWVDFPALLKFWPKRDPTLPARLPQERDRLTSAQLRGFVEDFAVTVRRHSRKPVTTGFNVPRPNAWHLARDGWDTDTPEQFVRQLRWVTPPSCDVISIHLYQDKFGGADSIFPSALPLLRAAAGAAVTDRRRLFVGEFGVPRMADRAEERRRFAQMTAAIRASGAAYAALWNVSPRPFQPEWDVAPGGDRAYQLDVIAAANRAR